MDVFPLPQGSYYRSSGYRTPNRPTHPGVDLAAPEGTPEFACITGRIFLPWEQPSGAGKNLWIIDGAGRFLWKYFHMSAIAVRTGDQVRAGQLVGAVGHTGHVIPPGPAGAHLHVERHNGTGGNSPTDPTPELDACERAGHFVTHHLPRDPEDEPMTDEERAWLRDQFGVMSQRLDTVDKQLRDIAGGTVVATVNAAALTHDDINQLADRLKVKRLPDFTVNRGT